MDDFEVKEGDETYEGRLLSSVLSIGCVHTSHTNITA